MDALNVYKHLNKELDKFESPSIPIVDFNYWVNRVVSDYIAKNYSESEVRQKTVDDIRSIFQEGYNLNFVNSEATLPGDYRHLFHLELNGTFIAADSSYAAGQQVVLYPKRRRSNRKGLKNAYNEPNQVRCYYQIIKDAIKIYVDPNVTVATGQIDYIQSPDTIYLNPDTSSNYNDTGNNSTIQFSDEVTYEIIKLLRTTLLENFESGRYSSSVTEEMKIFN